MLLPGTPQTKIQQLVQNLMQPHLCSLCKQQHKMRSIQRLHLRRPSPCNHQGRSSTGGKPFPRHKIGGTWWRTGRGVTTTTRTRASSSSGTSRLESCSSISSALAKQEVFLSVTTCPSAVRSGPASVQTHMRRFGRPSSGLEPLKHIVGGREARVHADSD
ncbi:unnamed protein product [Symbiodinium sp. CCMP2592]|nr:unnamed protein product [Symbiodinium sp. CCMP2592]